MSEENKTEKRDILAVSEANVNFLANVLDPQDFKQFIALKEEIKDTWHKKQIFRTETEMRVAVLDDGRYPTPASKYWQCVREQNVFFENLMSLSFDYRKNEVKIKKLQKKLHEETERNYYIFENNTDFILPNEIQDLLSKEIYAKETIEEEGKNNQKNIKRWEVIDYMHN